MSQDDRLHDVSDEVQAELEQVVARVVEAMGPASHSKLSALFGFAVMNMVANGLDVGDLQLLFDRYVQQGQEASKMLASTTQPGGDA